MWKKWICNGGCKSWKTCLTKQMLNNYRSPIDLALVGKFDSGIIPPTRYPIMYAYHVTQCSEYFLWLPVFTLQQNGHQEVKRKLTYANLFSGLGINSIQSWKNSDLHSLKSHNDVLAAPVNSSRRLLQPTRFSWSMHEEQPVAISSHYTHPRNSGMQTQQ